jgi:hypothetical protein
MCLVRTVPALRSQTTSSAEVLVLSALPHTRMDLLEVFLRAIALPRVTLFEAVVLVRS